MNASEDYGAAGETTPSSLTKSGVGTLLLSGANTYTGGTTVTAGTLKLSGVGTLGDGGLLTVSGGTVDLAGVSLTGAASVSGISDGGSSSGIITSSSGTATLTDNITGGSSQTFSGTLAGSLALTVNSSGAGVQVLSGSNTNSGATTVSSGTLRVATLAAQGAAQPLGESATLNLGTANAPATLGTLQYSGAGGTLAQNVTVAGGGNGAISNTGGGLLILSGTLNNTAHAVNPTVLSLAGGQFLVNGQILGTSTPFNSSLALNGAVATISPASLGNSYNGPTSAYGGSTLVNGAINALPTNTTLTLGAAIDTGATTNTFDLNGTEPDACRPQQHRQRHQSDHQQQCHDRRLRQ